MRAEMFATLWYGVLRPYQDGVYAMVHGSIDQHTFRGLIWGSRCIPFRSIPYICADFHIPLSVFQQRPTWLFSSRYASLPRSNTLGSSLRHALSWLPRRGWAAKAIFPFRLG